mgnify:CR=1 FL=1
MKKALLLLAAAAACAIALPATAARNKTLKGSGKIVTETRDVGSFHAVEAGSIAHVLVGDYPAQGRRSPPGPGRRWCAPGPPWFCAAPIGG